jgi:hypothetical protein
MNVKCVGYEQHDLRMQIFGQAPDFASLTAWEIAGSYQLSGTVSALRSLVRQQIM